MYTIERSLFFTSGLIILLFAVYTAEAQEVCYGYDNQGRLVGVVDEQGRTAVYEYDAVGNMLAIRRNDATGPIAITSITQTTGLPGQQVQILGIGFSKVLTNNQVTFGGFRATVLSATACSLIVEIPVGAGSGPIQVTTPVGTAISSESFSVLNMIISPPKVALVIGASQQFNATVTGSDDQRVIWSVNGIVGGNSTVGTITPQGFYTAPKAVPTTSTVTIEARSVPFSELSAQASITILAEDPRTQTITMISGNGAIGSRDPANQFTLDGGATWQGAFIIARISAWSIIAGTQWINRNPDSSGPANTATRYRTMFVLPPRFTNPSLTVLVLADNVATIFLNGVQIGRQPFAEIPANFQDPPSSFTSNDQALFRPGDNILEFDIFNFSGPTGFDYKATVKFIPE